MMTHKACRWALASVVALTVSSCGEGHRRSEQAKTVILPATEVHDGWYFAAGDRVLIEGTVNGDLYAAGGTVEVSGTVNGDLLVAGGDVRVSGTVSDDVRAGGGSVSIDGKVGKNVTVAGGNMAIGRMAEISGGVLAAAGNVQISGSVARDVRASAGAATVSGNIGGDLAFYGEEFKTLPGARIGGSATIRLADSSRMSVAEGTVLGKVDFEKPADEEREDSLGLSSGVIIFKVLWSLWLFVAGFVLFAAFRRVFDRYASVLRERTLSAALWGVVGLLVMPVVILLLALTLVGIPLAIFVLDIAFWMIGLSQLATALLLGSLIMWKRESAGWAPFWAFALGLLIVRVLSFVPVLGWVNVLVGLVLGFGALAILIVEGYTSWRVSRTA